jgi:hypothetical protein
LKGEVATADFLPLLCCLQLTPLSDRANPVKKGIAMKIIAALIATLLIVGFSPVQAQSDATAERPTTIDPLVVPISFSEPPIVRATVGRDEPFLEGTLAYGYGGRVSSDLRQGKQIVVPAGSPAYAVPMLSSEGGNQLVWCAFPIPVKPRAFNVCQINSTLAQQDKDSLMVTGFYVSKYGVGFSGGGIVPDKFQLGAPIRVTYYVQDIGKITHLKAVIRVGDVVFNKWIIQWGTIVRPKSADEKLIAVAGGVLGITPDTSAKGRFTVRIVAPLSAGASALLTEIRNDVRH